MSNAITIEFGSRQAAKQIREDPQFRGFLAENDDAREATVRLKGQTPEPALADITGQAADSKAAEAEKAGQVELSREERRQIDFTREGVNVPKVRSIKGIATKEGVSDFLSFADLELTVDENREVLKEASREEQGRRGLGRDRDAAAQVDKRLAEARASQQEEELDRAKDFALIEADREAQEFVESSADFDIGFDRRGDRLEGTGQDFERLEERHQNRSQRAQTVDEQRSAQPTRDPIQWASNPDKFDFPGIDTVQPAKLHAQRPEEAREIDESQWARIADSKEQWAQNPDEFDLLGVDTPSTDAPLIESTTPDRPAFDAMADGATTESRSGLFSAELAGRDVPASQDELFGEVGTESQEISATNEPVGLAEGKEADISFMQAEEQRASGDVFGEFGGGPEGGGEVFDGFADDRDTEGQLTDFGMETDATQHRESRTAEEQASMFGVDDRKKASRGSSGGSDSGEQRGFEEFGGGVRENETLF